VNHDVLDEYLLNPTKLITMNYMFFKNMTHELWLEVSTKVSDGELYLENI
jgi:hypothetical protein